MAMSAIFGIVDSVLVLPPSFPSLPPMGSMVAVIDRDAARDDTSRDACHRRDMPEAHADCCTMICEAGNMQGPANTWQLFL